MSIRLISTGKSTGDEILDNFRLGEMVDTSDEWIRTRTGIVERRIAGDVTTEELAYRACTDAIKKSDIEKDDIELIVMASVSSDTRVPSSAYTVSGKLGLDKTVCFDINAACSGFIYAMSVAKSLMQMMGYRYALVIGAEKLSKYVNWKDRKTCILFGDGAGCAVLENESITKNSKSGCNLEFTDQIIGGYYDSRKYLSLKSKVNTGDEVSGFIEMNGRQVYKFATDAGTKVIEKILERNKLSSEDIAMVVPHQANRRIIDTLSEKTGIEIEKWFINLEHYGNTSSASIPIALDESVDGLDFNKNKGKYIISVAFGGGLSYGGILLKIR